MNHDAIVFDIDGTLWNACSASAKGWNAGLAKLGIDKQVSPEHIERVAGYPFETCFDLILPGIRVDHSNVLDTLNRGEIDAVKTAGGEFYPGVIEGIQKLSCSHRIFLVSNCQDWYMNLFLSFSGFSALLAGYDCHGMSGKPKHEMLRKIKQEFSLRNPVYVGDTEGDELAANQAGMAFIHVTYGVGTSTHNALKFNSFSALQYYFEGQQHIS